jgi:hypothetical protein
MSLIKTGAVALAALTVGAAVGRAPHAAPAPPGARAPPGPPQH